MQLTTALCLTLLTAAAGDRPPAVRVIDDFEGAVQWPDGGDKVSEPAKQGRFAMQWRPAKGPGSIRLASVPGDWTPWDRLCFWLHSEKANGQVITIVVNSENPANGKDWDYYFHHLKIDWQGWRLISLKRDVDLRRSRRPLGWDQVQYLSFNSGGWDHSPLPDTVLTIDDIRLVRDPVNIEVGARRRSVQAGLARVEAEVSVTNRSDEDASFPLALTGPATGVFSAKLSAERTPPLQPGESGKVTVTMVQRKHDAEPLASDSAEVTVSATDGAGQPFEASVSVRAAVPLGKRDHPLLFASRDELDAANAKAAKYEWARAVRDGILSRANAWLEKPIELPDRGAQWWHWYSCPKHGVTLKTLSPTQHQCPVDGEIFTGEPYDSVVLGRRHSALSNAARDLGLAYGLTGDTRYAQKAKEILLAYADKYESYELHDVRGGKGRSAARAHAQTLDESGWIIPMAWGYDLVLASGVASPEEQQKIEDHFLRPVAKCIMKNDAGKSNWQSWHNAGVGAIGFCLQDEELASFAINGKSGFRFQMKNSVMSDGFWFEGSMSYHVYTTSALMHLSEAAWHSGVNLYTDPGFKSLFVGPMTFTWPDGRIPAFNDAHVFSLAGQASKYEVWYARTGDPEYAWGAAMGNRRSYEALFAGAPELPKVERPPLRSMTFDASGIAWLRGGPKDDPIVVTLDYGPHGGGHGHPDKLSMTLWSHGMELAPDPGAIAYGVPLHGSWYRQTFSHNTITVDEKSQRATQGRLSYFGATEGLHVVHARCDTAYPGVSLDRTLILTPDYVLDVFRATSDEEHTYDWVYHDRGEMTVEAPGNPIEGAISSAAGYKHVSSVRMGETEETWKALWTTKRGGVQLVMLGGERTQVFAGNGLGNPPTEVVPLVVARRKGKAATFVSVIEPYAERPTVLGIEAPRMEDDLLQLRILRDDGQDVVLMTPGGRTFVVGNYETDARVALVSREGSARRAETLLDGTILRASN